MQSANTVTLAAAALALGLAVGTYALRPAMPQLGASPATACTEPARPMARLELLFGTARRNGPPVSDEEWTAFVDKEITPRFPDGLTILQGAGQWRGGDGSLKHERTHVLIVSYTPAPSRDGDIEAIRTAYKARFDQESVMRADSRSCVSF